MSVIIAAVLEHGPWDHHGWDGGGWWWVWGMLMMGAWIALVAWVVWLFAGRRVPAPPTGPEPTDRAREILAERYARGEISTDEYHERLDALR